MQAASCLRFGPSFLKSLSSPSHKAYNFGKEAFSVEAWIKSFAGGPIVARKPRPGGPNNGGWILYVQLGTISFFTDDGYASNTWRSLAGACSICDGTWHHISASRDEADVHIYLDGKEISVQRLGSASPPANVDCAERLTIGSSDQMQQFFTGYIAEVRIFNTARPVDDVLQDIYRRFTPSDITTQLIGYWPGEYGLAVDFAATRNTTVQTGSNFGAEKAPPLSVGPDDDFWNLFSGVYTTSRCIPFSPLSETITLTPEGFAILGGSTVLERVELDGLTLSWPAGGVNPFSARINFAMFSDNTAFWADPQEQQLFEGTINTNSTDQPYCGLFSPQRKGGGTLLNIGTGQSVRCIGAAAGVDTIPMDLRQQFAQCEGSIICNDTNLALVPEDPSTDGSKVLLTDSTTTKARFGWSFQQNGMILAADDPSMALSVGKLDHRGGICPVVITKADSTDLKQHWIALSDSSPICLVNDAQNRVITGINGDSNGVGLTVRKDGAPEQSWYEVGPYFLCAANMLALTAPDSALPGKVLSLDAWVPGNTRQEFMYDGYTLKYSGPGLIVVPDETNGLLFLESPEHAPQSIAWRFNMAPAPGYLPAVTENGKRWVAADASGRLTHPDIPETLTAPTPLARTTTYIISIVTANSLWAGTDEGVRLDLLGGAGGIWNIELDSNTRDPFEQGQMDTFVLENMTDVGPITRCLLTFASSDFALRWWPSFADNWEVAAIRISNLQSHTISSWCWVPTRKPNEYPRGVKITDRYPKGFDMLVKQEPEYNYTMSLCNAPAQSQDCSLCSCVRVHHTWIEVSDRRVSPAKDLVYFDCMGGHGQGLSKDVIVKGRLQGKCNLNDVVRMSTGFPIDEHNPLKEPDPETKEVCYGSNRTDGFENANIRGVGLGERRDGFCHQITNRYLWTCKPALTIPTGLECTIAPYGYSFTVFLTGIYGRKFQEWAIACGFDEMDVPFEFERFSLGLYLKALCPVKDFAVELASCVVELRSNIEKAEDRKGEDRAILTFLKRLLKRRTKAETANILNITKEDVDRMREEL